MDRETVQILENRIPLGVRFRLSPERMSEMLYGNAADNNVNKCKEDMKEFFNTFKRISQFIDKNKNKRKE